MDLGAGRLHYSKLDEMFEAHQSVQHSCHCQSSHWFGHTNYYSNSMSSNINSNKAQGKTYFKINIGLEGHFHGLFQF